MKQDINTPIPSVNDTSHLDNVMEVELSDTPKSQQDLLSVKYIVKAVIAFAIYASMFFIDTTVELFWLPLTSTLYNNLGFRTLFERLSANNDEILSTYQNMFLNNVFYLILFIIIVGLFLPEIIEGIRKLKKNLWQLSLIPLIQFATLIVSAIIIGIVSLFLNIPDTSINQEIIDASMAVSPWGNVFPTMIAAPFVEEIVFRAIIGGGVFMLLTTLFNRKNSKTMKIIFSTIAIVTATVFFGWIHVSSGDYLAIFPYLVMGLSMTLTYFLSGRNVVMSICLHMYHNIFAFFINML